MVIYWKVGTFLLTQEHAEIVMERVDFAISHLQVRNTDVKDRQKTDRHKDRKT